MTFIKGDDTARAARKATTSSRPRSLKKCGRLPMVGALAVLIAAVMLLTGIGGFGADAQAAVTVENSKSTYSTAEGPSFTSPMWHTGTGDNPMMLVGISWCNGSVISERQITSVTWTRSGTDPGRTTHLTEVRTQPVMRVTAYGYERHAGTAIYAWPTGTSVPSAQEGYLTVTFDYEFQDNDSYVTLGMVNFSGVDQTNPLGAAQSSSNISPASNPTVSTNVTGFAGGMVFDSAVITRAYGYAPSLSADSDQPAPWCLCRTGTEVGTGGAASTKSTSSASSTTMSWSASDSHYRMWAQAAVPLRPAPYTITATADAGGSIAPLGDVKVAHGDSQVFTITFDDGYELDKLTDNGTDVTTRVSAAGTYSISSVTEDHTLVATFKKIQHTLTYTTGANGKLTGSTTQTVAHGEDGTEVKAVPDAGYSFVGWSDGKTDSSRTDTNVQADLSVRANFAPNTYTITFDSAGGNEVDPINQAFGTQVIAPQNPTKEGYTFTGWQPELPATMPAGGLTVTAQWKVNSYTVTFDASGGSAPAPSTMTGTFDAPYGTLATTSRTGYTFVGWFTAQTGGTEVTAAALVSRAEDHTLYAQWTINQYALAYTAGANGTLTGSTTQTVAHGEDGTPVEAVPDAGYHFTKWSDDSTDNPRTDTGATAELTVTASFAINTYTITATADPTEGGTVSGSGTYNHGDEITLTGEAKTGYTFTRWTEDDAEVSTDATYTFTAETDRTLVAEFTRTQQPPGPDPDPKDRWSDIPDSEWQETYGIDVDQAYAVAQGYGDGSFRPALALIRAHCAKMIVDGFGMDKLSPTVPSFTDVPRAHDQYAWIEGGYAVNFVNGYSDGTYRPADKMLRQQFNSMLARVFVQQEIDARGGIRGADGTIYETLGAWYEAEGAGLLARFADSGSIYRDHRANTAYLILRGVVKGGEQDGVRFLDPLKNLTRAQAVAMIVRAGLVAEDF